MRDGFEMIHTHGGQLGKVAILLKHLSNGRTNEKRSSLPLISLPNFPNRKNTEPNLPGKKLEMKDSKIANGNQQSLIKDKSCQTITQGCA